MKLTKAQERAKAKLKTMTWQCAHTLQESIPTLEGLVRRGVAVQKRSGGVGVMFSPRTTITYKLKVFNKS